MATAALRPSGGWWGVVCNDGLVEHGLPGYGHRTNFMEHVF